MASAQEVENRFQIYRAEDAANLKDTGRMTMEPIAPNILDWAVKAAKAGYPNGEQVKLLVDIPGFSLTHVWFKKNFPLPLHSHDSDCLYYIIAGSLRLGTEDLGPGDSFFVPMDVPYAYRPGEEGVELLEFRTANAFNFVNHAKSEAFWAKAAQTCADNNEDWLSARPPSLRV